MNLASVFHFLSGRGEMYWAAAAAMAVGVALIAAALMWQVARWRRGNRRLAVAKAGRSGETGRVAATAAASPRPGAAIGAKPDRTGRPNSQLRPRPGSSRGDAVTVSAPSQADNGWDDPPLVDLLQRLQGAADRLEKMSDGVGPAPETRPESALKGEPSEVEYVFKASRC